MRNGQRLQHRGQFLSTNAAMDKPQEGDPENLARLGEGPCYNFTTALEVWNVCD
jgi:hypothetical protein